MLKKVSSILLAILLVATLTTATFAAGTVTEIKSSVFIDSIAYESGDSYETGSPIASIDKSFSPGEEFKVFLDPSKIITNSNGFTPETGMAAQSLSDAGISVKISGGKNPNLIESIALKDNLVNSKNVAYIAVKLSSDTSVSDKAFTTTIVLIAEGTKQELSLSGSLKTGTASTVTVSSGTEYVYLGNGETAQADSDIEKIKVDVGNDMVLHSHMKEGSSYYAVSTTTPTEKDKEMLYKLSGNSKVISLDSTGFDSTTTVQINSSTTMFVYDKDGNKIGTTDDTLKFYDKYYLSEVDVDINTPTLDTTSTDGDIEPEPDDIPTPIAGDDNPIPNTGISSVTKIAGGALIVGLLTIIVLALTSSKKKK